MSMTDQSPPISLAQRSYRGVLLLFTLWTLLGGSRQVWAEDHSNGSTGHAANQVAGQVRERASAALKTAQQDVQHAQAAAQEARARLDEFLSQHFDLARQSATAGPPEAPPVAEQPTTQNPEIQRLQSQLDDLQAERDRLLTTLTEAHPEVVDVDGKIAALETRIEKLKPDAAARIADSDANSAHVHALTELAERQRRQSEEDAAEYRRLFDAWKAADQALEAARAAESQAAQQLAAIRLKPASKPLSSLPSQATVLPQTTKEKPAVESTRTAQREEPAAVIPAAASSSSGTQTLALAALAIALAVAALAAVALARSSADPLFSSADEAAAALGIPVVGIVPEAIGGAARAIAPARAGVKFLAKLILAALVFGVVAYSIKNADEIWRFLADPVPGLRALFGL